jgi:type IV secretion system protein VirB6
MSACPVFSADGPVTVADALKSVDCLSGQAVEIAFSRLFGESGALGQALTLILTLYVALLALSLLTGRTSLRLNMLTPRMLQLGLVLTFATSWVAYQSVGWNLLVEAPDQVASILLGTKGSATQLFAARLDTLFDVIANSAHLAQGANALAATTPVPQIANTSPKPADLLWAASLMLLLGTVGVLIVARIALAAVMALGPVFIILALFRGTRGLFEGWLKAAVMLALTPMLAVLLGGGTLVLVAPMISALARAGGKVSLELATSIFLAAFVYIALMILAMRAAAMITSGWHLGGRGDEASDDHQAHPTQAQSAPLLISLSSPQTDVMAASASSDRVRSIISGMNDASAMTENSGTNGVLSSADRRASVVTQSGGGAGQSTDVAARDPRIRPLGQGFRMPQRITS